MKTNVLFLTFLLCISHQILAQENARKVSIDVGAYRQQLSTAKTETSLGIGNAQKSETIVSLPLPDGSSAKFKVVEYSILPKGVNSDVKTYLGEQVGNTAVGCRITLTKDKMIATIQSNGQIIVIERDKLSVLSNAYEVYTQTSESFECSFKDNLPNNRIKNIQATQTYTNGSSLRTYRMAIIVTNEFYVNRGNTDTAINTEIAAIINSLNGLYEREIAVRFTLVSPTNSASSNVFYRKTSDINTYYQNINALRTEMNTIYGTANYDLGHTLHTTGGGVAYYGVCNNSYKGGGWSGSTTPSSVLLMAHEVGHQFTAPHTFNGNGNANCSISNRNTATAFEPGSGSTIMSYFGTCPTSQNLTGSKESYFHTNSLDNMINYIQTGTGNTCGTPTSTGNTAPVVVAGSAYTIPKNTPFTLVGSGTDANGDILNYTWEEYDVPMARDSGALGNTSNGTTDAVSSTTAPLFRSRQAASPVRTFPNIAFVLNNANNPNDREGEDLPNVARTMVFRLTARDNRSGGGGVGMSSVTITVAGDKGPLTVSAPNGAESLTAGTSTTINWQVNNTDLLSANVKILLSIDGGFSFPFVLAGSTPNDGQETLLIPANIVSTSLGRVKIVSTNSVTAEFFDISNANFTITSACNASTTFICSEETVSGDEGSDVFNLGLSKVTGNLFQNKSKTFSVTGAVSRPLINYTNNTFATCQNPGNWTSVMVSFRVSKTGNYAINPVGDNGADFQAFSVFSSNTFNCSTLVGSNAYQYMSWQSGRTITLNECTTYYILIYTAFSPLNITLTINGTGDVVEVKPDTPDFGYTYAAINQSNNQITSLSASSNFSSLSSGTFTVYGLSYENGFDTSSLLNKTLEQAYSLGSCILFSNNSKQLNIAALPCPTTLTLINPNDNISSGDITRQASAVSGKIIATNYVTGSGTRANYQAKAIELNAGFKAESGTVFKAETGGCN